MVPHRKKLSFYQATAKMTWRREIKKVWPLSQSLVHLQLTHFVDREYLCFFPGRWISTTVTGGTQVENKFFLQGPLLSWFQCGIGIEFFTKLICELDIHKTRVSLALTSEVTQSRSSQILAVPEWMTVPLSQLMAHRSLRRFGSVRLGLSCYT